VTPDQLKEYVDVLWWPIWWLVLWNGAFSRDVNIVVKGKEK
jgi:hypothetical protein